MANAGINSVANKIKKTLQIILLFDYLVLFLNYKTIKQMEFKEFKEEILQRAKKANACSQGIRDAKQATDYRDLFGVISKNFSFCCRTKIIDVELLKNVKDLASYNFYINESCESGFLLADSATVHAHGSSTVYAYGSAMVEAYDLSTVRAWGSSTVMAYGSSTVYAYGSATFMAYNSSTVRAWGSATVKAYGSSTVYAYGSATVEAYDLSTVMAYGSATVEAYNSSTVMAWGSATVKAYGSSTVEAWGSATVEAYDLSTVEASGSSYINSRNTIKHKISDRAILRYYHENKVILASEINKN